MIRSIRRRYRNSSFDKIIVEDLKYMSVVKDFCLSVPGLDNFMHRIVNKSPFQDIVLSLLPFFIVGLTDLGVKFFWIVASNLVIAFALRHIIEAKRPYEYNKIKPISDISFYSFGFPSLESHMSIVIFGYMFISKKSFTFLCITVPLTLLIGFSRVYANSRFIHQILGSWLTGLIGLFIAKSVYSTYKLEQMTQIDHTHGMICLGVALLAYMGIVSENNDSRLLSIPKSEYMRVLSDIMASPNNNNTSTGTPSATVTGPTSYNNNDINTFEDDDNYESNRTRIQSTSLAEQRPKRRLPQSRRDSFYFLQRALQRRERRSNRNGGQTPGRGMSYSGSSPRDSDGSSGLNEGRADDIT